MCGLDLVVNQAGVGIAYTKFLDLGATLTGNIAADAATIPVTDITDLPPSGVIRIGDEAIYFASRDDTNLYGCLRGRYGTTAATHTAADPVEVSKFSDEAGRWWAATPFKRFIESSKKVSDLVKELRESTLTKLWVDESGLVNLKCSRSPWFRDAPPHLTDDYNFRTLSTDDRKDNQITRATCFFNPTVESPGSDPAKWSTIVCQVDVSLESENAVGKALDGRVFMPWVTTWSAAESVAAANMMRKKNGAPWITFEVDAKDAETLDVGDYLYATTDEVVGASGAPRARVAYEVLSKKRKTDLIWEYAAEDVTGGVDAKKYRVIAPATVTCEYDSATDDQKEKYAWIGSGTDNTVGAAAEQGAIIQ
jgi:hypothetical protein